MTKVPGRRRLRKFALGLLLLVFAGLAAGWWLSREARLDTRFTGAYLLDDGRLVTIAPR